MGHDTRPQGEKAAKGVHGDDGLLPTPIRAKMGHLAWYLYEIGGPTEALAALLSDPRGNTAQD